MAAGAAGLARAFELSKVELVFVEYLKPVSTLLEPLKAEIRRRHRSWRKPLWVEVGKEARLAAFVLTNEPSAESWTLLGLFHIISTADHRCAVSAALRRWG